MSGAALDSIVRHGDPIYMGITNFYLHFKAYEQYEGVMFQQCCGVY